MVVILTIDIMISPDSSSIQNIDAVSSSDSCVDIAKPLWSSTVLRVKRRRSEARDTQMVSILVQTSLTDSKKPKVCTFLNNNGSVQAGLPIDITRDKVEGEITCSGDMLCYKFRGTVQDQEDQVRISKGLCSLLEKAVSKEVIQRSSHKPQYAPRRLLQQNGESYNHGIFNQTPNLRQSMSKAVQENQVPAKLSFCIDASNPYCFTTEIPQNCNVSTLTNIPRRSFRVPTIHRTTDPSPLGYSSIATPGYPAIMNDDIICRKLRLPLPISVVKPNSYESQSTVACELLKMQEIRRKRQVLLIDGKLNEVQFIDVAPVTKRRKSLCCNEPPRTTMDDVEDFNKDTGDWEYDIYVLDQGISESTFGDSTSSINLYDRIGYLEVDGFDENEHFNSENENENSSRSFRIQDYEDLEDNGYSDENGEIDYPTTSVSVYDGSSSSSDDTHYT